MRPGGTTSAHSVGLENPPVTEVSRQHPVPHRAVGHRSTSRPTRARTPAKYAGSHRPPAFLMAPLDPAVSKTNHRPSTRVPVRNRPTRMTGCASPPEKQCRVQRQFRQAVRLRMSTRVLRVPAPVVDERYAARSDEGQIVDQPHRDAGQPQRGPLVARPNAPLHS